jgi:hypothetical protein
LFTLSLFRDLQNGEQFLFYEGGQDNLYNKQSEKVYDPMEGILTQNSDLTFVFQTITSQ